MGEIQIIVPPIAKPTWTRVAGESLERLGVGPRALQNYLSYVAIAFVAYFIAGKLGQATTNIRSSNLGPVWPAYGVAVAAILLCGYRVWIGIAGAAFLVALLSPVPLMTAAGQATGSTVAALTGAFLLHRIARFDPSLSRLRDVLALIVFGALGSAIVSASVGVSVLYATRIQAYSGLGSAWTIYWLGDSTGVLLVTPLVLTFPRLLKIRPWVRVGEFAGFLLALTAICFIIFGNLLSSTERDIFAFVVLPFVMWGAIRFGLSGAALATLVIATIATWETALGRGPFAQSSPFVNAVLLDVYFAVLSASGMTLAAVIAERERAEREREQLAREQVAMETRLHLSAIVQSSDERFHLAAQAGRMYAYEWDVATGMVTRSEECLNILGLSGSETQLTREQLSAKVHPDDRALFLSVVDQVTPDNPASKISYRVMRSDDSVVWVERNARAFFDEQGRLQRMVGMVADITERKQAEEALRVSEERLRLAQQAACIGTFDWNIRTGVNTWTPELEAMYGLPPGGFGGTQTAFENLVHPDDRAGVIKLDDAAMKSGQLTKGEWRVVWADGSVHWIAGRWQVFMDASGEPSKMIGVNIDVTERKLADAALANVSRKLIEAQEQERARIARELHDDIGQRLALLANELQQAREGSSNLREARKRMKELESQTCELASDIHSLSHELHSSKLEYLGIVPAMEGLCKEFSNQHKLEISFKHHDLPSTLPPDVSLCFFRVLQEALNNSAKYSGAKHIDVELLATPNEIRLTVSDSGEGFDLKAAREGLGLGLTSMEERLKIVRGELLIESQPKHGTTIQARVPLRQENNAMRAAG